MFFDCENRNNRRYLGLVAAGSYQPSKTMNSKPSFFLFFSFFIEIFPIFAPVFRPKKRKTDILDEIDSSI